VRLLEQKGLRQLEDQCIQEQAPPCQAACPVHVDVRGMIAEIVREDFAAALRIYRKAVPFPGIFGRICSQPCRDVCKRTEAGSAICIAALERASVTFGAGTPAHHAVLPPRGKRVAIVGAGLSGISAAFDLARKGYATVIWEAEARLGGSILNLPEQALSREVVEDELAVLNAVGVEVRPGTRVGRDISLEQLRQEYDCVYLGVGAGSVETFGLDPGAGARIRVEPLTLATSQTGVFAGGSLLRPAERRSPILSLSDGRRAAISMDRYLQKVSLSAARINEGPYVTRLYTTTKGIAPLPAVSMADPRAGYTREESIREARRCIQCQCLECVKVCEYLHHYEGYPKKYLRTIYNNLSIVQGNRQANQFINSCSLCNLCGEVCPTGLNMGPIFQESRQKMVLQERMPPSAHDFALRDMEFSNGDKFVLARNQPGTVNSEWLFFPGCQLSASAPAHVEKTYSFLCEMLSGGVGLMLRCCGAPADWAGRSDLFQTSLAEVQVTHEQMGRPRVVVACSSCYRVFKTHLPGVEVVSLWRLFVERGLPETAGRLPAGVVSIHDACATRYEPVLHHSVRGILQRLGWHIEELALSRAQTECCGYGGLMWLANPALARDVVRRRIAESPNDYLAYCVMCRDLFAAQGKRTWHILDLIWGGDAARPDLKGPGYSQRHENRTRLKRRLLQEVWGEEMESHERPSAIRVTMSADVLELLETRLILMEDVQQVIDHAERTGRKLLSQDNHHWLAHYRPGEVTYWVEYTREGDQYVVHRAYSHRMKLEEVNP